MEIFNEIIVWLEDKADLLGAVGTLAAFTTLFFTNGSLMLKRLIGKDSAGHRDSFQTFDSGAIKPDYGGLPSVACLPLRYSGIEDEDFPHALLDEIIILLQEDKDIACAPRTSVLQFRKAESDIRAIAAHMGVDYVLEGSLRQSNGKIRYHAQLLDATGATLWSGRTDIDADYGLDSQECLARFSQTAVHKELVQPVVSEDLSVTAIPTRATPAVFDASCAASLTKKASYEVPSYALRSRALILCMLGLLGIAGLHRFYVGRPWTGLLYFFTFGLFFIGTALDFVVILFGYFGCGKGHPVTFWTKFGRAKQMAKYQAEAG